MELLKYIFSSFWIWIGVVIILWIPFDGVAKIICAIKGERKQSDSETEDAVEKR